MGFINGVKTVFSDLKEYINQIDCPDEENLVTDPKLLESLQSIEQKEEAFKKSSISQKNGKGNSIKQQVVETVAVDSKVVKAMAKKAQEKQQQVVEKDGEER